MKIGCLQGAHFVPNCARKRLWVVNTPRCFCIKQYNFHLLIYSQPPVVRHFTNWWHLSHFLWTTAFTRTFATSILWSNGMIKWYDISCVTLYVCVCLCVCVCVCVYRIKLVKNYTILNNFALKAVSNADNYKYRVPSRTEMVPNKTTCHPLVQHNINTVKSRQSEAIRSCPSVTTRVFTRPRLQSIDTMG